MVIRFSYGFTYKGMLYGWYRKELYRLPTKVGDRQYGVKKLTQIMVGCQIGYRIKRDRKTIEQLRQKTVILNEEVSIVTDFDIPESAM
jgi:hypothetical protein